MAKRFIDSKIFADDWFNGLSQNSKLAWIYFFTNCDHAGIYKNNEKLFEFQTGVKGYGTVMKELGNRLITVRPGYFFLPKFISFQYPKGLNNQVALHRSVFKRLEEFDLIHEGVIKGLGNTYESVKDKDKDKERIKRKERAKKIFEESTADESFIAGVCISLSLPWRREKNIEFVCDQLHKFLHALIAGRGFEQKTDDDVRTHFINTLRKQIQSNPEILKLKNVKSA